MRIRKNAKVSPLEYVASSLPPGTVIRAYDCKLNQSPWDVMDFDLSELITDSLPPRNEVDKNDNYNASGSIGGYIGDDKSSASNKLSSDVGMEKLDGVASVKGLTADKEMDHLLGNKDGDEMLCFESNGNVRKLKTKNNEGYDLHENHNILVNPIVERSDSPMKPRHSTRKRKPTSSLSNPCGAYYYYSGFGPTWGKKRGSPGREEPYTTSWNSETSKSLGEVVGANTETSSISSQISSEQFEQVKNEKTTGGNIEVRKEKAQKLVKSKSLKFLMG